MSRATKADQPRKSKSHCCGSRPRCGRCPIRMLKAGTLPDGYTVKRRRLVMVKVPPKRTQGEE